MSGILAGGQLPTLVGTHDPSIEVYQHLPAGRWACTVAQVDAAFNVAGDSRRKKLWDDWQQHLELVRSAIGTVSVCWLSGSFFTSKAHPGDIDCVYVMPASAYAQMGRDEHAVLNFAMDKSLPHGLEVDAYPLLHEPFDDDPRQSGPYVFHRGYWDDFWSRMRGPNRERSVVPRRGYLEVIVDGYK